MKHVLLFFGFFLGGAMLTPFIFSHTPLATASLPQGGVWGTAWTFAAMIAVVVCIYDCGKKNGRGRGMSFLIGICGMAAAVAVQHFYVLAAIELTGWDRGFGGYWIVLGSWSPFFGAALAFYNLAKRENIFKLPLL